MENMTFEQANEALEKSVGKMENKALTLEESLKEYSNACELLAFCINKLENCKGEISDINEKLEKLQTREEI